MYTAIFSILSGGAFFYAGYNYSELKKRMDKPVKQMVTLPNHSFFAETVSEYSELKQQHNKYIIYSRLHKCPLSTHQLINKATIAAQLDKQQKKPAINDASSISNSQTATTDDTKIEQKAEVSPVSDKKHKLLFEKLFKDYARQLVQGHTCNSVQLIYGPIFSKDTPYKVNGEAVKNVFTSNLKVAKDGQWLTDRYYTIVVCNRDQGSYLNGFAHRKSNYATFRFLNYLTSLKKLEEQTGLVFNVDGGQLTRIDYSGILKQRAFESQTQPAQATKQQRE